VRISINDSDSGYANYLRMVERLGGAKHLIHITLNGEAVRQCFTADEEEGSVLLWLRDDEGLLRLNDDQTPMLRWLYGSVAITVAGE
jgi:hypothetical protein